MIEKIKTVYIYTDGACRGNPGPGGWGALLRYNGHEKSLHGGEPNTTNNKMELKATIKALEALKKPCHVIITTDSIYVKNGITHWISNWKKNHWKTANKKSVKNMDLWKQLLKLASFHHIDWKWVKGHSGHPENEIADQLANQGIDELPIS